jgi:hypothetical protein
MFLNKNTYSVLLLIITFIEGRGKGIWYGKDQRNPKLLWIFGEMDQIHVFVSKTGESFF